MLSAPPGKAISICHVAVGDLWAGAEVQLKVLLSKLVQKPEFNLSFILFNEGRLEKEIDALGIPVRVFPESRWGSASQSLVGWGMGGVGILPATSGPTDSKSLLYPFD
jgi:hypothetical protein